MHTEKQINCRHTKRTQVTVKVCIHTFTAFITSFSSSYFINSIMIFVAVFDCRKTTYKNYLYARCKHAIVRDVNRTPQQKCCKITLLTFTKVFRDCLRCNYSLEGCLNRRFFFQLAAKSLKTRRVQVVDTWK